MTVVKELELFTAKEHINTLGAYDSSSVWAVLHNLGKVLHCNPVPDVPSLGSCCGISQPCAFVQSQIVQVDLASGQEVKRFRDIGINSHGLVAWQGMFVMLSSKETSLMVLNPADGSVEYVWSVRIHPALSL